MGIIKTRVYFILLNVKISFNVLYFVKYLNILKKITKKRLALTFFLITSSMSRPKRLQQYNSIIKTEKKVNIQMEVHYLTQQIEDSLPISSGCEDKKVKKIHKYRKEFLRKMVRKLKVQSVWASQIQFKEQPFLKGGCETAPSLTNLDYFNFKGLQQ